MNSKEKQSSDLSFEQMPEDIRYAVIQAYTAALSDQKCPQDDNGSAIQRRNMELLASNIVAGFAKLTSC
ncbi:hypothetical protein U4P14_10430 [Klebsiella pneumoniae]|uniref:hypothetical protein n=1 Tax=Klebsiella pneumoniae TaxID=573 RepID=UPI002FE39583